MIHSILLLVCVCVTLFALKTIYFIILIFKNKKTNISKNLFPKLTFFREQTLKVH